MSRICFKIVRGREGREGKNKMGHGLITMETGDGATSSLCESLYFSVCLKISMINKFKKVGWKGKSTAQCLKRERREWLRPRPLLLLWESKFFFPLKPSPLCLKNLAVGDSQESPVCPCLCPIRQHQPWESRAVPRATPAEAPTAQALLCRTAKCRPLSILPFFL